VKNIILGFKHAWSIPSLPQKINDFYSHIFTRIFRFIGGVTVLITVMKIYDNIQLHNYFNETLCNIIITSTYLYASIFIVFILTINLIKIIYTIFLLVKKPKTFEVRNSPLNLFASQIANILTCIKIGCIATGTTAAVVAGGVTFDTLIEKSGRSPIFIPMMGEGLNLILGKPSVSISDVKLPETSLTNSESTGSTDFNQEAISKALTNYKDLSLTEKESFWNEVSKEFKK